MKRGNVDRWLVLLAGMWFSAGALAAPPTGACLRHGQGALQAFTQGKFEQAVVHFSPRMAAAATAQQLHGAWSGLTGQFGAFQELGRLVPRTVAKQQVLVAPIEFAKTTLAAIVACDDADQLTTFRLVPAAVVGGFEGAPAKTDAPPEKQAMATLSAQVHERQVGPHPPVKAHVQADGVRVRPLDVTSPLGPLRGVLTVPAGAGPFPAVVLVPGSGPADHDETIGPNKPFRDLAQGLARAGIASLRFDKRTFDYPQKVAANAHFGIDDEYTDDALTALRLLSQQPRVDPRRIFVLGLSEGAMMVPRVATRFAGLAGGIMLAAPARPLLVLAADQSLAWSRRQGASAKKLAAIKQQYAAAQAKLARADAAHPPQGKLGPMTWPYLISLRDYHQVAVAKKLDIPLLIAQGGRDFQVSPEKDFRRWKQALSGKPGVRFRLYPGLSHLFRDAGGSGTVADYLKPGATDARVIADTARWIKAQPAR